MAGLLIGVSILFVAVAISGFPTHARGACFGVSYNLAMLLFAMLRDAHTHFAMVQHNALVRCAMPLL